MFKKCESEITPGRTLLLVILLAAIWLALIVTIPIHATTSSSPLAASWGNRICGDISDLNCPVVKVAASWGNQAETDELQQGNR